jgi:ABC-type branched-subunit amino acid transport system substrate-binding protein
MRVANQTPKVVLRQIRQLRASRAFCATGVALAVGVAGCGSSDEGTSTSGGGDAAKEGGKTLIIANVQPYSGADAAYGPEQDAGCIPATNVINEAGGVLGNKLDCKAVDTRSNPTDAVPAVQKMFATESDLVGVIGPSSNEVQAVHPMLAQRKVPFWPDTGDPRYNTQESPFYWRIATSDDAGGVALAVTANELGYKRIVIVAGNDSNSQTMLPTMQETFPKLGGEIIETVKINNGESSYRAEASRVAKSNPDAIIFPTTDPQTAATFLGEFKQLHGSVPVLGQVPPLQPKFSKAIAGAIGRDEYESNYYSVHQFAPTTGPAYEAFKTALLAAGDRVENPEQWVEDPFSLGPWDAVTIMALAMIHAKTTEPTKYNASIMEVTAAGEGKTVVNTFPEGKKALEAGEQIQYVGAFGPIAFTESHNFTGGFVVTQAKGKKESKVAEVTSEQIATAVNG